MTIKLKDIIPATWNTRGNITPDSVKELAASIREQGLIQPIVVWKNADGQWVCIAGNRRLVALREIGYELDEADTVIFDGDENDAKMITVTENLQREDVGPVEEAALVAECLDAGMTAEEIAAKTGRSASWVNRRRKLIALSQEWKDAAGNFTALELEKIAAYPLDVQCRVAKAVSPDTATWATIQYNLDRESRDLDEAKFDTSPCRECVKRTGAEGDLFGVVDGKLGACLDCKCFEKLERARVDAAIADATKGAGEVVRVKYAWELPGKSESSYMRTNKHPCAYVHEYNGEMIVRWGESQKAKKEREESKRAEREEKTDAENAKRRAVNAVVEKLDGFFDGDGDEWPEGLVGEVTKLIRKTADEDAAKFAVDAICAKICEWHDAREWAEVIGALPFAAGLAGLTDDEVKTICESAKDN